jgi:hypothetical protein
MRITIRVAAKDNARAWGLLVRHSAGTALPSKVFVVSEEALGKLQREGIELTEIPTEPGNPWDQTSSSVKMLIAETRPGPR